MIARGEHLGLLVVNQDDAVARRLQEAARETGYYAPTITMTDGRFALEHLWQCIRGEKNAAVPEVVLVGLRLGSLNGIQFTRELRRYEETRDLFVAFIPAVAGPTEQDAAENAGCDFFLKRPDSPAGLGKMFTTIAQRCVAKASPPWTHATRLWHASLSGSGLDVSNTDLRTLADLRAPSAPENPAPSAPSETPRRER